MDSMPVMSLNIRDSAHASQMRRLGVMLPASMLEQVRLLAEQREITSSEMLRQCIVIGLYISEAVSEPETEILLRRKEELRQLVLLF